MFQMHLERRGGITFTAAKGQWAVCRRREKSAQVDLVFRFEIPLVDQATYEIDIVSVGDDNKG